MLAILNSLNAHNFPFFQPILMILASKFMVHSALSDKTYFTLGLLSPSRLVAKFYGRMLFLSPTRDTFGSLRAPPVPN